MRPYLTNKRLPEFLRLKDGVIEILIETGLCDNAARALHFVLKQEGIDSVQWNMVTQKRAHSALRVVLSDGRYGFVDPFFGLSAFDQDEKRLLSPDEMQVRARRGVEIDDVFVSFSQSRDTEFYQDFKQTVFMGPQGGSLNIDVVLPFVKGDVLHLGKIDGQDRDVYNDGAAYNMTPFWHYMGRQYDRSLKRIMRAPHDMRVEITLIYAVEEGVVTSDPRPAIEGKKMVWDLKAGDFITFTDGNAAISWERLNSYLGVDQIALYSVGK